MSSRCIGLLAFIDNGMDLSDRTFGWDYTVHVFGIFYVRGIV